MVLPYNGAMPDGAALGGRVRLLVGDITSLDVDAVVNPANGDLWMGAGVAGAIKRAGGEEIERQAVAQGPVAPGEAVVTGGGSLRARFVIHAVTVDDSLRASPEAVRRATASALRRCAELGVRSVAFPALGTGVGRLPYREAADAMLGAIREHLRSEPVPGQIVISVLDGQAWQDFHRVLTGG